MKRSVLASVVVAAVLLCSGVALAEPGFSSTQAMPTLLGTTVADTAPYTSISCPTPTSCTAVGPGLEMFFASASSSAHTPTAVVDSSGTWGARSQLSLPPGATGATINDVWCPDSSDCVAVGGVKGAKGGFPAVVTESSGTWGTGALITLPSGLVGGELQGVWCASIGNCVATGWGLPSGSLSFKAITATESSGTWSAASELPAGSTSGLIVPVGMACTDLSDCVLAADQVSFTGKGSTLVWQESSGTWAAPTAIPTPAGTGFLGYSVACPTSTTCLLVGGVTVGQSAYPASSTETSGVWATAVRIPVPRLSPTYPQGAFISIACPSSTLCESVGAMVANNSGSAHIAAAITWSSGVWSSVDLLHGTAVGSSVLDGVSCGSTTSCVAVGATSSKSLVHPISDTITPVRPVTVPLAPTSLVGDPVLHGVVATWQPPTDDGGSPVTSFKATVVGTSKACEVSTYHCRFAGLVNGHTYRIEVTDTTLGGTSSAAISPPFVAGAAPSRPVGIRVKVAGTMALLTWKPSIAVGEKVTSYAVAVYLGKVKVVSLVTRRPGCALHLRAKKTYHVEIVATDASGSSTPGMVTIPVK